MELDVADYQLSAARAATAHLQRLHHDLRVRIIGAWLQENPKHFKAADVDRLLSAYRLGRLGMALEEAEILVSRYSEI